MSKVRMNVSVTADFIIAGVFFAARNACALLRDAHILHDAKRFSSAYGLAVFCREELGKSEIWLERWNRCLRGETVTLDDLRYGDANDHKKKLERVGKHLSEGVFSAGEPPEPGTNEEAESLKLIFDLNERTRQRDPEKTHAGRLDAFFVRPGGNEVNRAYSQPYRFDCTESAMQLLEAGAA